MQSADIKLVLPLAALFVAFFVAPLCVLIALSLSTDARMHELTAAHYVKFFTDSFNYSILWATHPARREGDAAVPAVRLSDRLDLPRAPARAGRRCCCSW